MTEENGEKIALSLVIYIYPRVLSMTVARDENSVLTPFSNQLSPHRGCSFVSFQVSSLLNH